MSRYENATHRVRVSSLGESNAATAKSSSLYVSSGLLQLGYPVS